MTFALSRSGVEDVTCSSHFGRPHQEQKQTFVAELICLRGSRVTSSGGISSRYGRQQPLVLVGTMRRLFLPGSAHFCHTFAVGRRGSAQLS